MMLCGNRILGWFTFHFENPSTILHCSLLEKKLKIPKYIYAANIEVNTFNLHLPVCSAAQHSDSFISKNIMMQLISMLQTAWQFSHLFSVLISLLTCLPHSLSMLQHINQLFHVFAWVKRNNLFGLFFRTNSRFLTNVVIRRLLCGVWSPEISSFTPLYACKLDSLKIIFCIAFVEMLLQNTKKCHLKHFTV